MKAELVSLGLAERAGSWQETWGSPFEASHLKAVVDQTQMDEGRGGRRRRVANVGLLGRVVVVVG